MNTPESWQKMLSEILLSFNGVSMWSKDVNGFFTWMSEEMLNRHGYDLEEIIGGQKSDASIRPITEADKIRKDDEEIMRTGKPKIGVPEQLSNRNGTTRWVLACKFPLYGDSGEIKGVTGFHIDFTKRKRVEKQIFQAAAHVLHEACSDLNGISLALQVLLTGNEVFSDSAKEELQNIQRCVFNAATMTRSNLELISAQEGLIIKPRKVDFRKDIMDQVVEITTSLFNKKQIQIDESFGSVPEGKLTLMVDPLKFQLIFKTLFINAVEAGATTIAYGYERLNDRVRLNCYNNSSAIDEETQRYLFVKDVGPNPQKKPHGTGMGLYFCRQIVELHGGRLFLEHTLSNNPNFIIELPLFLQ